MQGIELCDICGIPLLVGRECSWDPNGVISLSGSPKNRMVFFESENIDQLFKGIEELIGLPIEHIVIESRRREFKEYIEDTFPAEMRENMALERMGREDRGPGSTPEERETRLALMKMVVRNIIDIGRVYGYGDQRLGELWDSGADCPWRTCIYRNPYSVLFAAADMLGSVEVFEGLDMEVKYSEIGDGTYRIEVFPGEHLTALTERLKGKRYAFKDGDISYERCPGCGVPVQVAGNNFDRQNGSYTDPDTGWRMALFGPSALDFTLQDLQSELGDVVPDTVVEAQRRYIKSSRNLERWNRAGTTFQQMVALRGLGNLVEFEGDETHLSLKIENSCLHLPMVGTAQALVELAYRTEKSRVEWDLADDGDLTLDIIVV